MKALTIWQPWASLIMIGAKPYEFRRWAAPARLIGERIVIHAGAKRPTPAEIEELAWSLLEGPVTGLILEIAAPFMRSLLRDGASPKLPLGVGLGTAVLGRPILCTELFPNDSQIDTSMWAWPLTDIQPFAHPLPATGHQQFWDWPEGEAA